MASNSPYQIVTDRIIDLLTAGTIPWRKPWHADQLMPHNAVSGKAYRGINVFMLGCTAFRSPYWLTFNQARKLGGSVCKGEKSTPVVFWKWLEDENDDGTSTRRPLLRYYRVFNVAQCDLPADKIPATPDVPTHEFTPIAACEAVVNEMPSPPAVQHDANAAFYRPSTDSVHMPPAERFEQREEYYSTLFHELTHATGHKSRLNRGGITATAGFGSPTYSREELVAEMGAAFLCGHCRIEQATLDNSAAYIDSWISRLRGDARLVVTAAAAAQKAADFILGVTFEEAASA